MRRAGWWYTVAAVLLVLGVLVVARSRCWLPRQEGDVAMPPVTAGPVEVVRAYVSALDEHDIATAKALSTPEMVQHTESTEDSWYRNTKSITDLRVGEPMPQGPESGQTRAGSKEAVMVPVEFDLDQCDAESIPDGTMGWGYLVSRASPAERWLITDEGHG